MGFNILIFSICLINPSCFQQKKYHVEIKYLKTLPRLLALSNHYPLPLPLFVRLNLHG